MVDNVNSKGNHYFGSSKCMEKIHREKFKVRSSEVDQRGTKSAVADETARRSDGLLNPVLRPVHTFYPFVYGEHEVVDAEGKDDGKPGRYPEKDNRQKYLEDYERRWSRSPR